MADVTPVWLVLLPDLSPDWKAFYRYWRHERALADRKGRQAGREAFEAQLAAASVLRETAWGEQALDRAARKAELRDERHAASIERRRRYYARWMRDYRARTKAEARTGQVRAEIRNR